MVIVQLRESCQSQVLTDETVEKDKAIIKFTLITNHKSVVY